MSAHGTGAEGNRTRIRWIRQGRRHRDRYAEQRRRKTVPGEGSLPWHDKPSESYWARLATPMAGNDRGLVLIPEVGDEVLVAFEREDLRFPYVLGASGTARTNRRSRTTTAITTSESLQSRKKHYLLFDDGASGVVELRHEKGRKIMFDDNGFAVQDENGNVVKVDSNSGAMTIEAKGSSTSKPPPSRSKQPEHSRSKRVRRSRFAVRW